MTKPITETGFTGESVVSPTFKIVETETTKHPLKIDEEIWGHLMGGVEPKKTAESIRKKEAKKLLTKNFKNKPIRKKRNKKFQPVKEIRKPKGS